MLKLTDIRKTTRRTNAGDGRTLHPHFLRDRSLTPRIEMAIHYLESMLGRPRRELDQEVVAQLFGDHKLARCIVACLAASYHHRCRTFAEVLPAAQVAALGAMGISTPSELRLWLFRRANTGLPGFVGSMERALFLRQAGAALGLTVEQLEPLIALDSPEHAILIRSGPQPTADDVIIRFNYSVVAAILANAPIVRIVLASTLRDAGTVRELCATAGVPAQLVGRELILHGQQDALGGWSRHGARLVRLLAFLLACGLPARSGEAIVAAPHGDRWHFHLNAESFGYLGMGEPNADGAFSAADLLECWRAQDALISGYASVRHAGADDGWALRRATEPFIGCGSPLLQQHAILPTLFVATRGTQRVPLVLAPATPAGAARLARVASGVPLITLRIAARAVPGSPGTEATPGLLQLAYTARDDIARLPLLLAQAVGEAEQRAERQRLEAVFAEACRTGVLTEQQIAERLACAIEDIPAALARPEARVFAEARSIRYIEGFGICTAQVLTHARAAAHDVTGRYGQATGAVQTMRALSRRLREVTGTSEGIECLIAYLGDLGAA
jgi:hypothetical protein